MPAIHLDENERRWLLNLAVEQEIAWLAVKLRREDPQGRGLQVTLWPDGKFTTPKPEGPPSAYRED